MEEELRMTPEEINQSYVAITTRAKGPPSITVKVVKFDAEIAARHASELFDTLTKRYKERFDAEQSASSPLTHEDPDYDPDITG